MSRRTLWVTALLLGGCGEPEEPPRGPPLPFNKVPPSLTRVFRRRTLAEWLECAQSAEAAQRAEAPWALAELATDAAQVAAVLEQLLDDPAPDVRYAAVVAVGRVPGDLGAGVSRRTAALLGAPEPGLASAVRTTLQALGARAVPALVARLAEDDPERVTLVLRSLGELGPSAAAASDAMVDLQARREPLRGQASWALEQLGAAAAPALARRLPDAPDDEALTLLGLLARLGPALAPHVEALGTALSRPAPVRRGAADALLSAGPSALPMLDRLAAAGPSDTASTAAQLATQIRSSAPR